MTVYKLVKLKKDGNCYPLFIDKDKPFLFGQWMHCEFHPTKGFAPRSINRTEEEPMGGWHCTPYSPYAPHLSETLANGEKRVWIECEAKGQTQIYKRCLEQGGDWILVEWLKPIRVIPYEEVYKLQGELYEELLSKQTVHNARTA